MTTIIIENCRSTGHPHPSARVKTPTGFWTERSGLSLGKHQAEGIAFIMQVWVIATMPKFMDANSWTVVQGHGELGWEKLHGPNNDPPHVCTADLLLVIVA